MRPVTRGKMSSSLNAATAPVYVTTPLTGARSTAAATIGNAASPPLMRMFMSIAGFAEYTLA